MVFKIKSVIAFLIFFSFSANVFAYSQQSLANIDDSQIKIIKTIETKISSPKINSSPTFINRLRVIFSSSHLKKQSIKP